MIDDEGKPSLQRWWKVFISIPVYFSGEERHLGQDGEAILRCALGPAPRKMAEMIRTFLLGCGSRAIRP